MLAHAEAKVHDVPVETVHFHEVGALDAIADVVGVVSGFCELKLDQVTCRAIPVSHGTVRCEHGLLPVPPPAVLHLMQGLPTEPLDVDGETVTPTAAALLRVLVTQWQSMPAMTIDTHGCGAGTKDFPRPNIVRLIIGEGRATVRSSAERVETLTMLSTNIDDMNPEWLPPLLEQLMSAGALDAWTDADPHEERSAGAHAVGALRIPPRSGCGRPSTHTAPASAFARSRSRVSAWRGTLVRVRRLG